MRAIIVSALLCTTLLPAWSEETRVTLAPSESADAALLQGKWEGVEVGKEADGTCTLTVSGNTMHFEGARKAEWYKATFTLPANTQPNQLKGTITDCPRPDVIGQSSTGIYKIADGKLTLVGCRPGTSQIPTKFEPDSATGSRVFVFTKVDASPKPK